MLMLDDGWVCVWISIIGGTAIGAIRQAYDLLALAKEDFGRFFGKFEPPEVERFRDVYMPAIHSRLEESVTAYVTDFGELERRLTASDATDDIQGVANDLAFRNERMWHVKFTVEAQARAWLKPLPEKSIERTYVWSVLRVYYGRTVVADQQRLQAEADMVANQVSAEALDTPSMRVADKIRSGELHLRPDLIDTIRDERASVLARYKVALNLFHEIKVGAARKQGRARPVS